MGGSLSGVATSEGASSQLQSHQITSQARTITAASDLSMVDVRHRHIIFPCLQEGQNLLPVVVIMDSSILSLNLRPSSLLSAPLLNYFLRQWSSLWLGNHCNRKLVRSNRERDEKKLARSNREREGQRASQR